MTNAADVADGRSRSPRVAVIVRTRDRPEFLERALRDIGAQTFDDAEVVVVDDHGDARSASAVVAESAIASRVRLVRLDGDRGGRCAAANAGIEATDAEFVVLHDDDDLWHREFLAETVSWLDAHPGDAGVMVPTEIRYEERRGGVWVETSRAPFWEGMDRVSLSDLLTINRAVPISFLYRRDIHDQVGGYDESLEAVEDWELYLRILPRRPIGFLAGRVLAFWSQRPDASGTDANSMFDLQEQHSRDDRIVRDRALGEWIEREGAGLPLYLADLEKRLAERIDRRFDLLERQIAQVRREAIPGQQIWGLGRLLRRRFRRHR